MYGLTRFFASDLSNFAQMSPNNFSQAPPSYGSGHYGFGGFRAQNSVLRDRQVLCRDLSRLFLDHFSKAESKHVSSVLGWTELCHEVWNPGPQKTQIIHNENHHVALFDLGVKFPGPFLAGNCAEKPLLWVRI